MAQLRQDQQKYIERNTEVIVVGPEDSSTFKAWWQDHRMPFIGIPDPAHDISRLYSQQFNIFKGGRLPALAVIDTGGNICLMHYGDLTSDIPTDEEVLSLLDNINNKKGSNATKID